MDRYFNELEQCLTQLRSEHEQLLTLIERKQLALRNAAASVVVETCQLENHHVQTIGAIEKRRQMVVGQLTQLLNPSARSVMTLMELSAQAPGNQGDRLMALHGILRDLIHKVQQTNEVNRLATEGLLQHVQGMMHSIGKVLNNAGTYTKQGTTPVHVAIHSTLSLTG